MDTGEEQGKGGKVYLAHGFRIPVHFSSVVSEDRGYGDTVSHSVVARKQGRGCQGRRVKARKSP